MLVIQNIGSSVLLNDEKIAQIDQIARQHYCRIERVESKSEMQVLPVPKALTKTTSTSKVLVEQSNAFQPQLSIRKISIRNGSIEIHLVDHVTVPPVREKVFFSDKYILSIL